MPVTRPARSMCACSRLTSAAPCWRWPATVRPIAADVERHLFEPFFSTRSRGTGLGLYICRELCERHGASIEYQAAGRRSAASQRVSSDDAARRSGGAGSPEPQHEQPRPLQPAGGRRRARPAHAVRTDVAARRLRRRIGGVDRRRLAALVQPHLQRRDHRHAAARRLRARPAAADWTRPGAARRRSSSPPTGRPRTRSRR